MVNGVTLFQKTHTKGGEKKNSVLFSHKFKISAFQKLMCSGSDNTAAFLKWSVIEIYKD